MRLAERGNDDVENLSTRIVGPEQRKRARSRRAASSRSRFSFDSVCVSSSAAEHLSLLRFQCARRRWHRVDALFAHAGGLLVSASRSEIRATDQLGTAIVFSSNVSRRRSMRPVRKDRRRRPLALSAARDLVSRASDEHDAHARTPRNCAADSFSRRSRNRRSLIAVTSFPTAIRSAGQVQEWRRRAPLPRHDQLPADQEDVDG